jgi:hypothetical protein
MNILYNTVKSGGTQDYFRRVKVPGTATYWKTCAWNSMYTNNIYDYSAPSLNRHLLCSW